MSDDARRYSRQEVALVLGKVAQRSAASAGEGLTRAELTAVVREAGLDPAQIDVALAEVESQHKADARFAGLEQYVIVGRRVEGTLDIAALERAKQLANRSVGTIGKSELDEHGLSWFGRHVNVSVTEDRGRIEVQLEERFINTTRSQIGGGIALSVGAGLMTLVAAANAGLEAFGFILLALMPVLTYAAIRRLHQSRVAQTRARLEGLADQLVAALAPEPAAKALTDGGDQPGGLITRSSPDPEKSE